MMRIALRSSFLLLCLIFSFGSYAQGVEICNNGIDDDLNGFVDCYDRACVTQNPCDEFFISEDPACEALPTAFPSFSLRLEYSSPNRTSTGNGLSSVGDVDGDGIPDIITTNRDDNTVTVINTLDGSIKFQRNIGVSPYYEVMHADVDADGLAEIFVPTRSRSIVALSYDLSTVLWTANTVYNPGNIGIADFNGDGFPEVYARDELFDAVTGTRLKASDFTGNNGDANFVEKHITNGGTAVDILADSECADCAGLELVNGGRIYSVNINRATFTATTTLERSIDYFPMYVPSWRQNRTGTSVADYNQDGFLDVLMPGRQSTDPIGFTRLFFWDVQNNNVQLYNDPAYNWDKGTGRINIADVDGDGQLNATYVTGRYLYCLDETWGQKWRTGIIEQSSGTTGTTVFDFNGDGQFETVYRDERFLYIVNGNDGSFYTSVPCASLTYTEYPIVADVDADGATEICVSCMLNNNGNIYSDNDDAQIRIFESNGEQWVPARRIWNQHGYFNVNVNDDGTIPRQQQLHHLVFSSGICDAGEKRPLNTFLNQSPFLTSDGCQNYSAPDLTFGGNIQLDPPFCPNTDFTIGFDVGNEGDRGISTLVPISFYDGDPRLPGSTYLNTEFVLMDIPPGETITVSGLTVQGPGADFDLYISINDDGTQTPPISFPASPIVECDYDNVASVPVGSVPFPLNVTKLSDNNKCNPALPDNGSATASTTGTVDLYLEDFESRAENATSGSSPNGWSRTVANTTDWAEVRTLNGNKEFQTRDTDGEVVFSTEVVDISAYSNINLSIQLRSENRNGDVFETADYIRAFYVLDGGTEVPLTNGDFTGAVGPTVGGTGSDTETATAVGLTGNNVQIVVRMNTSSNDEYYFLDDVNILATGEITAGISFNWFFGTTASGTPDFVGATNTGMADGVWTVFARNDAFGCNSDTLQVTINATSTNPTVEVLLISEFTNCQAPDGKLRAVANGGAPDADFDFQWYEGLDIFTSPVIGINALATNLQSATYTVLVTEKASGCQAIRSATVPTSASFPVVTATKLADVTDCSAPNGEATASVTGSGVFWLEDFEDLPNNTSVDPGPPTAWSRDPAPGGSRWAEVRNVNGSQQFEFNPDNSTPVTWTSEVIDISSLTDVNLDIDLNAQGSMETSGGAIDSMSVYYRLNGGPEIALDSGKHLGNFGSIKATARNLSGSTLQIIVRARTSADNERYQIDNVQVSGVGSFTTGYTFNWYNGATVKPAADYTGTTYSGLAGGDYTVTATSDATGCTSDPVTITIDDLTNPPTVTAVKDQDNTSCDPLMANGGASASVGGATAGFEFRWFTGQSTASASEINPGSITPSITGLPSGIYTVQVTEIATGCINTDEITIDDIPPTIVANPAPTDVTNCAPSNGELNANPSGGTAPYTQLWFIGNQGSPDLASPDLINAQTGLDVGQYTLVVRDANGCTSPAELVSIADNTTPPLLTSVAGNQSSCDPSTPVGTLDFNVGGQTTGYTFSTYIGQSTINEVTGSPSASLSGLTAGIYTTVVQDIATGCTDTLETFVDGIASVIVSGGVATDVTNCTPANGTLDANPSGGTAPYTQLWFIGSQGSPDITNPDFTGPQTGLDIGDYTLVVQDGNGCTSPPELLTVGENTTPPVLAVVVGDQTSCDPSSPSGSLTFNVGGTDIGFEFRTYSGQNTISELPGSPSSLLTGLDVGTYTTVVRDLATGCTDTLESTVNDVTPTIIPNGLATDVTNCAPVNGTLDANPSGGTAPYTQLWFNGNQGSPDLAAPDFTGSQTGLSSGDYTLVVRDANGCTSSPELVVIGESLPVPITLSTSTTPQTACDATLANGSATVAVNPAGPAYTYQWFIGQNTNNPVVPAATGSTATGLLAGTYTVLVTNPATGCFETEEATVIDNIIPPTFQPAVVSTNSNCVSPNGSITIDMNVGNSATDYRFELFAGSTASGSVLETLTNAGNTFNGYDAGTYTVRAFNTTLGCAVSSTSTIQIMMDPLTNVSVDEDLAQRIIPADCGDIDGRLVVNATPGASFNFQWFAGDKNIGLTAPGGTVTSGATSSTLDGIESGRYTVIGISNASSCRDTLVIDLPAISAHTLSLGGAITDNTNCSAPNGSVELEIGNIPVGNTLANYEIEVYQGGVLLSTVPATNPNPTLVGSLDAGDYTFVAVETGVSCNSTPLDISIGDATILPGIAEAITPNAACSGGILDGSITLDIDGAAPESNYSYSWYRGTNSGGPTLPGAGGVIGGSGELVTQLDSGFYFVEVENNSTNCIQTKILYVPLVRPTISITTIDPTPNDNCNPSNGFAEVTNIAVDGAPIGGIAGYDFTWYDTDGATILAGPGAGPISPATLAAGTYYVSARNTTSQCESGLAQFEIEDISTPPFVTATITNNINCTGATPTGEIILNIDGSDAAGGPISGLDYTIEWLESLTPATPLSTGVNVNGDSSRISQLPGGTYYAIIRDINPANAGCQTVASFNVLNAPPTISIATIDPTPNDNCNPSNGFAEVTNIAVDGAPIGGIAGYDFTWYDTDGVTILAGPGAGPISPATLAAGTYFVSARNTTSQCESGLAQFEIEDISTPPFVTATITNNINCTGATPTGEIILNIDGSDAAGGPISGLDYTIEWLESLTPATPLSIGVNVNGDSSRISQLPGGTYYAIIRDINPANAGCQTVASFNVLNAPPTISIATIDPTPNDNCNPSNGFAEVTNIAVDGAPIGGIAGYDFTWYDTDGVTILAGPGAGPISPATLAAGTYFVSARNTTSQCESGLAQFEIEDVSTPPFVTGVTTPNLTCAGATPTGSIALTIDGSSTPLPAGEYQVNWFDDQALTFPISVGLVNGDGSLVTQLPAGTYYVRVEDLLNPDDGCFTVGVFRVIDDRPVLSIAQSDVLVTPNTSCAPFNGTATVNFVLEDGMPMPTTNYTFEWLLADAVTPIPGSGAGNSVSNLAAGTYYLRATNNTSNCAIVPPYEFIIEDQTQAPLIQLLSFAEPTRCDGLNQLGNLRVQADGSTSIVDYTFEWHEGDATGPVIEPNNFEVLNLAGGDYTVIVTNSTTGCTSEETFTLNVDVTDLLVTVSSSPWTSCIADDGSVFAAVTNTDATYDYEWYVGLNATGTPDFTTNPVPGLTEGDFTVVAVDQADAFCVSTPATVRVEDLRIFPEIITNQDAALTNCDITNPNGQLSATTLLGVTGFSFSWYEGSVVTADTLVAGPVASMLPSGTYAVRVQNPISGCFSDTTAVVGDSTFLSIPARPDIEVLSQLTSCISDNGALAASVNGVVRGYTFDWYNSSTPGNAPDFTGVQYVGLGEGPYSVIATDEITGCVSPPADTVIIDQRIIPEFNVTVEPATCNDPTGFAVVDFIPGFEYTGVEWTLSDGTVITGPGVFDVFTGTYQVRVFGAGGCSSDTTVEVGTEIEIYNGVSPNGDGANDIFIVDCLELFQNNNVKIFNRAGQLVYETDNYNNADISFDGKGNRGIYIDSNNVPDGTYFYIVDKRDGSDPRSGYLELIR